MPENDDDWEGLAAAVYRAVLQMLPASAMSWFGGLRDRSLAVATEVNISFCLDKTSLRCNYNLLEALCSRLGWALSYQYCASPPFTALKGKSWQRQHVHHLQALARKELHLFIFCCLQAYTSLRESPGIIAAELAGVSGAGFQGSENSSNAEFRVRANLASREASAILCIEDNATLEMTVKLPPAWPLRSADVECKRKVSMSPLHKFLHTKSCLTLTKSCSQRLLIRRDKCNADIVGVIHTSCLALSRPFRHEILQEGPLLCRMLLAQGNITMGSPLDLGMCAGGRHGGAPAQVAAVHCGVPAQPERRPG